jgi:tRNA A-37 threonylcarbamoyl transferase component Bud32
MARRSCVAAAGAPFWRQRGYCVVGTLIGQYRIGSVIGTGRRGTVYEGEHTLIGRRSAIRMLDPELSRRRDLVLRFFTEARAAAAVKRAGVVQILDFGFAEDGTAYLVMELLDGRSIATALRDDGAMPVGQALKLIRQVARTLALVHAAGIIHRDLQPGSIHLVRDLGAIGAPRIKILDFGIAKLDGGCEPSRTEAGKMFGTPLYMAPEQFAGQVGERSDIYALGCILFEMLVGRPPFQGDPLQLGIAHTSSTPPAPSSLTPGVPPEIDALIARCLAKPPGERFASMTALAGAIDAILDRQATMPEPRVFAVSAAPPAPVVEPSRVAAARTVVAVPSAAIPTLVMAAPQSMPEQLHPMYLPSETVPLVAAAAPPAMSDPPAMATWSAIDDPGGRDFESVFGGVLPSVFRDSQPAIVAFFGELFATARRVSDLAVQLGAPSIDDLELREHYVLFVDDIDAGPPVQPGGATAPDATAILNSLRPLSTTAFRARVAPLAELLASLRTPPGSVLITILAAPQLGQGARETIFALRSERNLFVVPIAASELRRACETGSARTLLLSRIADLHTVSDPFAMLDKIVDPTRCIGFAAEVADLVQQITAGGKIVSVAGPRGSGKTTVVAMAEYGCDTSRVARRFVRLACSDVLRRDPDAVLRELQVRVRAIHADDAWPPLRPVAEPSGADEMRTVILGLEVASTPAGHIRPARGQLVIVFEDADWLIRLASSETDLALRDAARELWRGLAQLCSSGGHTVIVTSVRDFQDQVPLERPVAIARVPLRALNRQESDRLVTSLGELVGFRPTRRALARLHHVSGGNVYALRLLCSNVIRAVRERAGYSPLAMLEVVPRMIDRAAAHVVASGVSFREHVAVWLSDIEKVVLQHVAREQPRSPRGIRRALEGSADTAQVVQALDGLELMGLVESRRGRHRVRMPLLGRWINAHLDPPSRRRAAISQGRAALVAIGVTISLLLGGAYEAWLRDTRSAHAASLGDCTFELDTPDRVGSEDSFKLLAYQYCTVAASHHIAIAPVLSSLRIPAGSSDCAPAVASCTTVVTAVAGEQARDIYQVQLRVDGQPLIVASIQKDPFAAMRMIGEKAVPTIAWVQLLLSVMIAFHKDLKRSVLQLLRYRERAAAEPKLATDER